ncbi:MAG: hypothetical protein WC651_00560 [Candidatus Gracilibacteria bacterium]|jgi:hypothetical protein
MAQPNTPDNIPQRKPKQTAKPGFFAEAMKGAKDTLSEKTTSLKKHADDIGQGLLDAVPKSLKLQMKLVSSLNEELSQVKIEKLGIVIKKSKNAQSAEKTVLAHIKTLKNLVSQLEKINPSFDDLDYSIKITERETELFHEIAMVFGEAGEKIAEANGVNVDLEEWKRRKTMAPSFDTTPEESSLTPTLSNEFNTIRLFNLLRSFEAINAAKQKIQEAKKRGDNVREEEKQMRENTAKIFKTIQDEILRVYSNESNTLDKAMANENTELTTYTIKSLKIFEHDANKIFNFLKKQNVNTKETEQQLEKAKRENRIKEAKILIDELSYREEDEEDINVSMGDDRDEEINVSMNQNTPDRYQNERPEMPDIEGIDLMTDIINTLNQAADPKQKEETLEIKELKKKLKEEIDLYIESLEKEDPSKLLEAELGEVGLTEINNAAKERIDFVRLLEKNGYISKSESKRLEAKIKGTLSYEIAENIRSLSWNGTSTGIITDTQKLIDTGKRIGMNTKKYQESLDMLKQKHARN